jgi:AcrR family transcriptional regulator
LHRPQASTIWSQASDCSTMPPVEAANDERRPLRVDAQRNRDRIIGAAQAAFAERGLDVPLEDVAIEAGVGIGTLYRRFASRDELIAACFERRVEEYARAAEEALEADDAWTGLCVYVERICAMQAADRGLKDVLTRTFPDARALETHRARGYDLSVRLIERAQAEGSLRSDVVPEDLVLLLMANAGVVQGAGDAAPDAWRRFVGLMLDGLSTAAASSLPPPPTPRQMMRAMRRLTRPPGREARES